MERIEGRSWFVDTFDEVQVRFKEFIERNYRLFKYPATILRWALFTIPPYFIGKQIDEWHGKLTQSQFQISNEITQIVNFSIFALLWAIGTGWRIKNSEKDKHEDRLYYALRWLYDDLGFDEHKDNDVRCTLWTPLDSRKSPESIRLAQAVDYVPRFGSVPGQVNFYRKNRVGGRKRRVARLVGDTVKPIGIVGKCVIDTINNGKPLILFENLGEEINFQAHMTNSWNFTKAEAKRLTQDRKSYMCISLMNAGLTDLIGIIFLDSRTPNLFTEDIGDKAQTYLPRIAELLVG